MDQNVSQFKGPTRISRFNNGFTAVEVELYLFHGDKLSSESLIASRPFHELPCLVYLFGSKLSFAFVLVVHRPVPWRVFLCLFVLGQQKLFWDELTQSLCGLV